MLSCKKPPTCQVQGGKRKHSKFLHFDSAGNDIPPENDSNCVTSEVANNACGNLEGSVYVPMVLVTVNGKACTWALLDSGSTNSFISAKLAEDLHLKGSGVSCRLSTLGNSGDISSTLVAVDITSSEGQIAHLKNVIVVPSIPASHPKQSIDIQQYPHLGDLPLPLPTASAQAQVLIGMDNAHLLIPLEIKLGSKTSDPYATRTMLGWSLNGPVGDRQNQSVFSHCISVEQQISNLWKMEAHDEDTLAMSLEDKLVLELWNKEIYYEDVHYSLPIPWKGGRPNLPNNRFMAVKRFSSLVHCLHKSGKMRVYEDGISNLLTEGYAEAVPRMRYI